MDDLISRQAAIDAVDDGAELIRRVLDNMDVVGGERSEFAWGLGLLESCIDELNGLPSEQPEITDVQAIEHLQDSGWMKNHDKQIYEMGLREQLADDSDSYDALLPSAERKGKWITYYHGGTDFSYSCNQCGAQAPFFWMSEIQRKSNYCYNCGARMDEVEE